MGYGFVFENCFDSLIDVREIDITLICEGVCLCVSAYGVFDDA